LLAALVLALPAAGALQPVRRPTSETGVAPLVRAGLPFVPAGHSSGRVRVVVRLPQPPLAAWSGRTLTSTARSKLNTRSEASRAYLARLDALQSAAAERVTRAIPQAAIQERYRVVFDGFALELPARKLPRLLGLGLRIYPSTRYTLDTNRSPDVIRAAAFSSLHGLHGEGLKIGVVDDGLDPRNPFLSGAGYSYPPGFPRGGRPWVNGKIIVARTFPGPHSGRQGRQAFVPSLSFHGTHVAGIAAGNAGTTAPAGPDHPLTTGLSGVAPRAQLGNYRVFNEPTPIGHVANTPEIIDAFEAAVQDGMDVINFSGGGAMSDPSQDPLLEAVANLARAGVVPVISAGNDRDDFGFGTVGSPGVAEDSIAVAAVSNEHVFAQPLHVTAPGAPANLQTIPIASSFDLPALRPARTLVDVGTIMGADGKPVDRKLCGTGEDVNNPGSNPLPRGSLEGMVALASRGVCSFVSKAERVEAAGGVGLVLVDNRFGEANAIPVQLAVPSGMISDLDGARLREFMAQTGGRTTIRTEQGVAEIVTGRSGIVTSFSSAGPTNFGHALKPDVAAPGGQILSSTSPESAGGGTPFAVFDGTSMSAPHVTGAVALLLQAHPGWTTAQMRSALVSTAGPAWGNTARTQEAPVTLEGGGLIDLVRADTPLVFTNPVSLSFGDLDANHAPLGKALAVIVSDAGGGSGEWSVDLRPQSASAGTTVVPDPLVSVPPGGDARLSVAVEVAAGAAAGDNYGFVVLRRGDLTRRIPYYFAVTRPALESHPTRPLASLQRGNTASGVSLANLYRFPTWPFGPPGDYSSNAPGMNEGGAEDLYTTIVNEPLVNFGVAVWGATGGALIHPWVLGSADENDVQGQGATPVNVNNYTFEFKADVGAAGVTFARPKRYWISVDSGRDFFSGRSLPGQYVLHSWRNDVYPPRVQLLTTRVTAGRPVVIARVRDLPKRGAESGIDPLSLLLAYRQATLAASAYDPDTGLVVFELPGDAPRLPVGRTNGMLIASDFQESKNLSTPNGGILPNTTFKDVRIVGVAGPAVSWLAPERNRCAAAGQRLVVAAGSSTRLRSVTFLDGTKQIARRPGTRAPLYSAVWRTAKAKRGVHHLVAVARDAHGREGRARRDVRVCR
jgi:subtilisin family serine protease